VVDEGPSAASTCTEISLEEAGLVAGEVLEEADE
jgi:hypothetical protein